MKINRQKKLIEGALDKYRSELDNIPDDLWEQTPPRGGWSYAEVYSHILQSDFSSLIACEKCARRTAELTGKKTNALGWLMLTLGSFPPVRVKTSPALASQVKKISKEDARNLLIKVRNRLDEVVHLLHDAPKNYRIKHPRLGMLNAAQWLKFTRIHTDHHLKQLKRVDKAFGR